MSVPHPTPPPSFPPHHQAANFKVATERVQYSLVSADWFPIAMQSIHNSKDAAGRSVV